MGDLTATLESPAGIVVSLFSRVEVTTTTGNGDSSNFSGAYDFNDSATTSLWTVAAAGTANTNIASGDYYPSAALNGARLALTAAFRGSTLSGTWTLRVKDTISNNTGSYSTATIDFTPGELVDSDGDGVANCNDVCPNDPLKTTSAGACGCGTVDTDFNANGVADCLEVSPVFTVAANAAAYAAGDSIVLRVRSTTPRSSARCRRRGPRRRSGASSSRASWTASAASVGATPPTADFNCA